MHSLSEFGANVPAFLAKLWKLVDDPETNELISWTEEGTSFFIRDQAQFSRKLLPMYYKHNNMASFIRQLNMYGFHKIVSADAGSLRLDKDEMEFAHQCFVRGHPYLLEHIKRKVGKSQLLNSKQIEEGKDSSSGGVLVKPEFMNKVLSEVKQMRGRQETVESRLTSMKQENEALWRELSLLRQKHIKQQTIVNKLIQFLVELVRPNERLSKRRYPLMINDVIHSNGKSNGKVTQLNPTNSNESRTSSGPTIHELDADSLLPDTDTLPNTITLHVPGSELAEVIETSLQPDVLNPDPEVLESLTIPLIDSPSSVPFLEASASAEEMLSEEPLETVPPIPDILVAASPFEMSPALVPALQSSQKKTNLNDTPNGTEKVLTQSPTASQPFTTTTTAPSKIVVTRKSTANGSKLIPSSSKLLSSKEARSVPATVAEKRQSRILPTRNRRKKSINGQDSLIIPKQEILEKTLQTNDELPEEDFAESTTVDTNALTVAQENDNTSGSFSASVPSPVTSQPVSLPMLGSPVPIINSPVSSPASHCSVAQSIATSPLYGLTITDVTSPLVVQPSTSSSVGEQLSPQPSPSELLAPYDMTLACTSQAGSSPGSYTGLKNSSYNRDDFDSHVGNMDSELNQLKEILNNSGMQLDANTLLGLFTSDDNLFPDSDGTNLSSKMDQTGNELMYYQPDLMDIEEIWNNENNRTTPPPSPFDVLPSELNTPIAMPTSPGFSVPAAKRRRH